MSVERYKKFFEEADVDHSGYLDLTKLIELFQKRGDRRNVARALGLYHAIDLYTRKRISLIAFLEALGVYHDHDRNLPIRGWAMRSVFRSFDMDGDGRINADDLDQTLRGMGKVYPRAEVERIIAMNNSNRDRALNFDEFFGEKMMTIVSGSGLYGEHP